MDALRRRIRAIAQERNLQPGRLQDDVPADRTADAMEFCEKHKISMDWLLCGYLQGLRRMTQEARAIPPEITEAQCKQVTQLLLAIISKLNWRPSMQIRARAATRMGF
jgi:hypothetical protein